MQPSSSRAGMTTLNRRSGLAVVGGSTSSFIYRRLTTPNQPPKATANSDSFPHVEQFPVKHLATSFLAPNPMCPAPTANQARSMAYRKGVRWTHWPLFADQTDHGTSPRARQETSSF